MQLNLGSHCAWSRMVLAVWAQLCSVLSVIEASLITEMARCEPMLIQPAVIFATPKREVFQLQNLIYSVNMDVTILVKKL